MLTNSDHEQIHHLFNLAKASRQESDFATAVLCYQKILRLEPARVEIHLELGNTFQEWQKIDESIQAYQQAIKLEPKQPVWVYQNLGQALQQQQRYPEAIEAYQQVINLDSTPELWVYHRLAAALIQEAQDDRALAIYQDLINLDSPRASEIYLQIAQIYQRQKQFFAAKAAYQQASTARALFNIQEVVDCIRQYLVNEGKILEIDILDNGCDPTGKQLALLAEQTQGRVVGTNVCHGFPENTLKRRRKNNEFYAMDGQNLSFEDASFDLVISLNVLEHVPNPAKYLRECYRVLRTGGIGFFSWYPVWSGATGHHVHPDMVNQRAQILGIPTPHYSLDGSSIPFWGHLRFSPSQMLSFLTEEKQYDPNLAKWMRDYTYYGHDLNRWFWRDIWHSLQNLAWEILEVEHRGQQLMTTEIKQQLVAKYGTVDDFGICGAKIMVRK